MIASVRTERPTVRPLNLRASVLRRVIAGALLCFLAAAAYAIAQTDRGARQDVERTAEIVSNNLDMQVMRINAAYDLSARFPDWDFLADHVLREGLCLRLLDRQGGVVRASCAGSSLPAYPPWFATLYDVAFAPAPQAQLPVAPGTRFEGAVVAALEPAAVRNQAWSEMSRILPLILLTVLCVCALAADIVRSALRPTEEVVDGLNRLASGELSYRLPSFRLVELQKISTVVNHMAFRLETTLAESQERARRIVTAQEEERQHLARELHDEFGQSLAAIMAIGASIETSAERTSPGIASEAQILSKITMSMMDALRSTLVRLRPATMDELGLVESLRCLVSGWNARVGETTQFHFAHRGRFDDLSDSVAVSLYRVAQEGLTNAARHAGAQSVRLTLVRSPNLRDTIQLAIEDDGRGCDGGRPPLLGHGLKGIRERIAALGGSMALETGEGRGMVLRATIPAAETRREAA